MAGKEVRNKKMNRPFARVRKVSREISTKHYALLFGAFREKGTISRQSPAGSSELC